MVLKKVLTIAGSDSSGGAGVQADLKTFHSIGVYGMSVVTALTAQNTIGVDAIHDPGSAFVLSQLRALFDDIAPDAVKTGMLLTKKTVRVVAKTFLEDDVKNIVVDPVMVSTSGHRLIEEDAVQELIRTLLPLAHIVTPNIEEAKAISGILIDTFDDMKLAAERIHKIGPEIVVVKGGHMKGDKSVDVFFDGEHFKELAAERIVAINTHGTGCTFSAAIAAYLAKGLDALEAVRKAKEFVTNALRASVAIGNGAVPPNFLWDRM